MLTGLILTNSHRLASVLRINRNSLIEVLFSFREACSSFMTWEIVDISNDMYNETNKVDWRTYYTAIHDYYIGLGLDGSINCPLFILGGHDVVPMPMIENPEAGESGEEYLAVDMAYCFDFSTVRVRLDDLINLKPRFAVGRLPLTSDWSVENLLAYLDECVGFAIDGIPVRGAAMTTAKIWLKASGDMMEGIPTAVLSADYVPLNNRMIVSPELDTAYEEWYNGYVHEIKKVDFLVCNLHGGSDRDFPFFIGQDHDKPFRPYVATQPSMMKDAAPYIFNTVACYGARYIDYEQHESMLLSAMASGTMLYCGACTLAYGCYDIEARYSELMMKLYNVYLHQGIPAGMALIMAKQDYFRTCHEFDGDDRAMFTVMEFNLFGCPVLYMQPKISPDYEPVLDGMTVDRYSHIRYSPKTMETVGGEAYAADDIHAYVRRLVDNNLSIIRQKVDDEVYRRLGLGKEHLQRVSRVSQQGSPIGYEFVYEINPWQSFRYFRMSYIVDTDNKGNIKSIIQTK